MCGITGLHCKQHSASQEGSTLLAAMNQKLSHRGPDGAGLQWFDAENFGLAHRRLSIIDLSLAASQPMQIADRYWLSFNGEIYNYLELKEELLALGATFKSESDAEVLLQAYIHWGAACLLRFNGMWAFAIYDKQKNTLFCARDPYGVKPFYYLDNKQHFSFASEIKSILTLPSYRPTANIKALQDYFWNSKIELEEEGFFKQINELLPGHELHYDLAVQKIIIKRYYFPEKIEGKNTAQDLKKALENAVRLRLRADVPLGFCLSGGLDSSSLLHLASQLQQQNEISSLSKGLHAFTAAHHSPQDERNWAAQMIAHTNANWHISELTSEALIEALSELIYHQDIPLLSTSTFAQSSVMKSAAQEGIKILIDGQGGDELFAGYRVFYPTFLKELFWTGQFGLFFKEWQQLSNSPSSKKYVFQEWAKDVFSYLPTSIQILVRKRSHPNAPYLSKFKAIKRKRFQKLQDHLAEYCQGHELKGLLRWEDRCSMQYSIESRTPFSDDAPLLTLARSLPANSLIKNGWSKFLVRKALDGDLPERISWRRDKKGFSVPESKWLMESTPFWQNLITEKTNLDQSGIVNSAKLLTALPRIFSDEKYASEQNFVFKYACYLIWIERFNITNFN
jgi:asparagine synthase (glutamine-hydrolysing)